MTIRQAYGRRSGIRIGAVKPPADRFKKTIKCDVDNSYQKTNGILSEGLVPTSITTKAIDGFPALRFYLTGKIEEPTPNSLETSPSLTWMCFHNILRPTPSTRARIVWNSGGANGYFIRIADSAGLTPRQLDFFYYKTDAVARQQLGDMESAWDQGWLFLALVLDGTTGRLTMFENGNKFLDLITPGPPGLLSTTGASFIMNGNLASEVTNGDIGHTEVYGQPWKDSEVVGFFNKHRHKYGI